MGRILLDPNAQAYSDDEIVGKVNAAAAKVDADQVEDGTLNKVYTDVEKAKLIGIEEGAKDDQSGDEIVAAIDAGTDPITREDALSQEDLKLVKSEPQSGERAVTSIAVDASDKLAADHSDTPEP